MKKLLIALAVLAVLLVVLYQVASHLVFKNLVYEECVKEYTDDKTISLVVKDVNTVCECITSESKDFGLINVLTSKEDSPKRQALDKRIEEKCINPNVSFDKLLEEELKKAITQPAQ